jgi:hypothetical protein
MRRDRDAREMFGGASAKPDDPISLIDSSMTLPPRENSGVRFLIGGYRLSPLDICLKVDGWEN